VVERRYNAIHNGNGLRFLHGSRDERQLYFRAIPGSSGNRYTASDNTIDHRRWTNDVLLGRISCSHVLFGIK
jgi:hypothetical protein